MGQQPKYWTLKERNEARKEAGKARRLEFYQTERGKALRSAQNKRAYLRRKMKMTDPNPTDNSSTSQTSTTDLASLEEAVESTSADARIEPVNRVPSIIDSLVLPPIPSRLQRHARQRIPWFNVLYLREMRGQVSAKEDDDRYYTYWDHPPYQYPNEHLPRRTTFHDHAAAVMGRRVHALLEAQRNRLEQYKVADNNTNILEELHSNITRLVKEWAEIHLMLSDFFLIQDLIERDMAMDLRSAKAYTVVRLKEEWDAVKKGREAGALETLYNNRNI